MKQVGFFTAVFVALLSAEPSIDSDSISAVTHFRGVQSWYVDAAPLTFNWKTAIDSSSQEYVASDHYDRARIEAKTPLSFQGAFRYYARDFDIEPMIDEINSKFSLGVNYKFLKSGLAQKKRDLKELSVDRQIDSLQWHEKVQSRGYELWKHQIRVCANSRLAELHQQYAGFLDTYSRIAARHYFDKKMGKEQYEEILSIKEENSQLLTIFKTMENKSSDKLPQFTLNMDAVVIDVNQQEIPYFKKRYVDRVSLSAFLIGEVYPRYDDANGNLVAGVQFSLPIEKIKSVEEDEVKRREAEQKREIERIINRKKELLQMAYAEYHSAMVQQVRAFSRYKRRRDSFSNELFNLDHFGATPDFLALYRSVDLYYRSLFDLIETKKRTLLKIVSIAEIAELQSLNEITTPTETVRETPMVRKGKRSIYLWKKSFDNTPVQYLNKFCNLRTIDRIYLSASRFKDSTQKVAEIQKSGVTVIPLFSENSWSRTAKHSRALERIAGLPKGTAEIHLDIEPHALDGWRDNDYALLKEFVVLVGKIRKSYKGRVSVALPVIYPQEYYEQIYPLVDRVDFMIYGFDSDKTIKKLNAIKSKTLETSLAVRTTDFDNEYDMEAFIEGVLETGITHISLFDFGSYRELVIQ